MVKTVLMSGAKTQHIGLFMYHIISLPLKEHELMNNVKPGVMPRKQTNMTIVNVCLSHASLLLFLIVRVDDLIKLLLHVKLSSCYYTAINCYYYCY